MTNNNESEERLILLWFDPNAGSRYNPQQIEQRLRRINDYVIAFTDLDQCMQFIQPEEKDKIFLITPQSKASQILPRVTSLRQIHSIFIFPTTNNPYENLINQYPKIIDIYDNLDLLCTSVKDQIEIVNNQLQTFSFFNQHQKSTKNLSKSSAEFLWFQLFQKIITHLPETKQTKQQMIEMCRRYYRINTKQLELIKQFDKNYKPDAAICWYSEETFIYKLINKALRDKDIYQLQTFRFFICDLSSNLNREYNKILSSNENTVTVYRGLKLDKKKFDEINRNKGKLISMNGYFLTTRLQEFAREFAMIPTKQTDVISVLFQIKCDLKQLEKNVLFADIAQFIAYPNGQVLFDLNACFHIESIEPNELFQLINMNLSNTGQTIIADFLEEAENEIEEKSALIVFGELLCDSGRYDQSIKYFEQLLKNQEEEDTYWTEFNLGRAFALKRKWKDARKHYECAYDLMRENPLRIKYTARVQSNIGDILHQQGQDDEALYYYEQAVKLGEKYYRSGHVDIADDLNSIAIILVDKVRFDEAIHNYQRALQMRENSYPFDHVKIAENLICIGNILYRQAKYNEAFDYHQQALRIRRQYYPSDHIDIARSLNTLGNILDQQGKHEKALNYHQQALEIKQKCNPPCPVDIANTLNNIGVCYENQNEINMALDHYRQALNIYKKSIPANHQNRIRIERNIRRLTGEE